LKKRARKIFDTDGDDVNDLEDNVHKEDFIHFYGAYDDIKVVEYCTY
jgi:hypothetical protein